MPRFAILEYTGAPDLPSATMLVLRLNGPQTSGRLRLATVGEGWAVSLSE